MPICFHAGASTKIQIPAYEGYSPALAAAFQSIAGPASAVSVLVNLLISKILIRFADLKVVLAESGLGWGAYLLEYTDFQAIATSCRRTVTISCRQSCSNANAISLAGTIAPACVCAVTLVLKAFFGRASILWPRQLGRIPRRLWRGVSTESTRAIGARYSGRTRRSCIRSRRAKESR